ncbi:MAG TPA: c-type cytochrome [Chthonomonadaceae bacterium]|nr:c-type cytochrome [Chthonomonadaceae bacterium]
MTPTTRLAATAAAAALVFQSCLIVAAMAGPGKKPPAKKAAPAAAKPGAALIAAGKKVYDARGCATCHAINGKGGSAAPDLTATGAVPAHTVAWLSAQVANPKAHNPDSTMPGFASSIQGKDLTEIGTFLASLKGAAATGGASTAPAHKGAPLDPAAVAKIEKMGGMIGPIAQNDDHLDVNLHLAGASVSDASLAILTPLKGVVRLDLGTTPITDAGLQRIKGLKELQELHLENTKITDASMPVVAGFKSLTYLNLYGDAVTDAGIQQLTPLTNLKHLYVWQTKVTPDGVAKLKAALPQVDIVMGWDVTAPAPKK